MEDITTILNCFRRPYTLEQQFAAIKSQTVPSKEIMIWKNRSDLSDSFDKDILNNCVTVDCNQNIGVWGRFAYALMAKTKYIMVLDDDTICGSRWTESCLKTINEVNGLLCTIGIIFNSKEKYIGNCRRVGWDRPNEITERVDFGGHCWFFKREWLSTYWRELPDLNYTPFCAEDMHFSVMLQKYLGLNTYVPPHPINDRSLWGSQAETALQYGGDDKSIWGNNIGNVGKVIEENFQKYQANGWKIINT